MLSQAIKVAITSSPSFSRHAARAPRRACSQAINFAPHSWIPWLQERLGLNCSPRTHQIFGFSHAVLKLTRLVTPIQSPRGDWTPSALDDHACNVTFPLLYSIQKANTVYPWSSYKAGCTRSAQRMKRYKKQITYHKTLVNLLLKATRIYIYINTITTVSRSYDLLHSCPVIPPIFRPDLFSAN